MSIVVQLFVKQEICVCEVKYLYLLENLYTYLKILSFKNIQLQQSGLLAHESIVNKQPKSNWRRNYCPNR